MNALRPIVISTVAAFSINFAEAHEFWLDPEMHQLAVGDTAIVEIRVGQAFEGSSYSFIPRQFRRFDFAQSGAVSAVEGRIGDRPAVTMPVEGDGLLVLMHETTDSSLVYNEFEKFVSFVEHKDAAWTIDLHRENGFPETGFKEIYSRYAKTLIGVGSSEGQDQAFGLLTEIVALENPYTDDMSDGMDVAVLYENAPRMDTQIEIFEKASDGTVNITTVQTDGAGHATILVKPDHRYMLDAVVLREPSAELTAEREAVWESLWANLTFAVPAN